MSLWADSDYSNYYYDPPTQGSSHRQRPRPATAAWYSFTSQKDGDSSNFDWIDLFPSVLGVVLIYIHCLSVLVLIASSSSSKPDDDEDSVIAVAKTSKNVGEAVTIKPNNPQDDEPKGTKSRIAPRITTDALLSTTSTKTTMSTPEKPRILALFDVDGTLTVPRGEITPDMMDFMKKLSSKITVGIVGGSDLPKQEEQLGVGIAKVFPWNFSQNGLVAYKNGELLEVQTLSKHLGEDNVKRIVNWVMAYLSKIDIPVKRGTFIEFRSGMFNISPIGRNCSREERNDYEKFDLEHKIRQNMVEAMAKEFADLGLKYSIGGQISFDCFPVGWDKTYCLKFIKDAEFDEIHFFGDKTFEGGNDFEIFSHERTIGHTVTSPEDTKEQCTKLFMS